jgi:lipid-A-disaccharide synthase
MGEVTRLGADFAAASVLLASREGVGPAPVFIAPMANARVREVFAAQVVAAGASVRLLDGQSREALSAADAVLVASGTATLETMLCKRPMVVAYRVAPLTAFIARDLGLVKTVHCSHPNLLADEALVPELLQEAVTPASLATALARQLDDPDNRARLEARFRALHESLRRGGARQAATAVLDLLRERAAGR